MQSHEYRALPAPRQGIKVKGARTPEDRFARAVEGEMNRMAREGWEYVRSDTLPSERRQGLFGGRATVFQTLLVFRRPLVAAEPQAAPPQSVPALAAPVAAPPLMAAPPRRSSPVPRSEPEAEPLMPVRATRSSEPRAGLPWDEAPPPPRKEPPVAAE